MAFKADIRVTLYIPETFKNVTGKVAEVLASGTQEILATARKNSPHKSGHNMRTMKAKINKANLAFAVEGTSGYSGYLEVGTFKMPARPYIRPAYDQHAPRIRQQLANIA